MEVLSVDAKRSRDEAKAVEVAGYLLLRLVVRL